MMSGNRVVLKFEGGRKPPTERKARMQEEKRILEHINKAGLSIEARDIKPLRDGYVVLVPTPEHAAKLHHERCLTQLTKVGLAPRRKPADNAVRTLVIFPHSSVFDVDPEELRISINNDHPTAHIESIWTNAEQRLLKIQFASPAEAEAVKAKGFRAGLIHIHPDDIQIQEHYDIPECTHCYDIDAHETRHCPNRAVPYCSTCAETGHRFDVCPNRERVGCLNCRYARRDPWLGHVTRAGACPIRREVKARYRSRARAAEALKTAPLEDRIGHAVHSAMASYDHARAPHRHASSSTHRSFSAQRRGKSRSTSRQPAALPPSTIAQQPQPSHATDRAFPPLPVLDTEAARAVSAFALMPPPQPQRPLKKKGKRKKATSSSNSSSQHGSQGTPQGQVGQGLAPEAPLPTPRNPLPSSPMEESQTLVEGTGHSDPVPPTSLPPKPMPTTVPEPLHNPPNPPKVEDKEATLLLGVYLAHCHNIQAPNSFNSYLHEYMATNKLPSIVIPPVIWNSSLILNSLGKHIKVPATIAATLSHAPFSPVQTPTKVVVEADLHPAPPSAQQQSHSTTIIPSGPAVADEESSEAGATHEGAADVMEVVDQAQKRARSESPKTESEDQPLRGELASPQKKRRAVNAAQASSPSPSLSSHDPKPLDTDNDILPAPIIDHPSTPSSSIPPVIDITSQGEPPSNFASHDSPSDSSPPPLLLDLSSPQKPSPTPLSISDSLPTVPSPKRPPVPPP